MDLRLGLFSCSSNLNINVPHDLDAGEAFDLPPKNLLALSASAKQISFLHEQVSSDDNACLTLELGGGAYAVTRNDCGSHNGKASAVTSLGSQMSLCQVDNCRADLSNAKDYHRRHKVCQEHAKALKAQVGKHVQRFCQQCSRFHLLQEFDEGKRSCRQRLAGHNKRRRKTQPESTAPCFEDECTRTASLIGFLDMLHKQRLLETERNTLPTQQDTRIPTQAHALGKNATRSLDKSNGAMNDSERLLLPRKKSKLDFSESIGNLTLGGNCTGSTIDQCQANVKSPSDLLRETQTLLAMLTSTHPEVSSLILSGSAKTQRALEPISDCEMLVSCMPQAVNPGTVASQYEKTGEHAATGRIVSQFPSEPGTLYNDVSLSSPSIMASHEFPINSGGSSEKPTPNSKKQSEHYVENMSLAGCCLSEISGLNRDSVVKIGDSSTASHLVQDIRTCCNARPDQLDPMVDLQTLPFEQKSEKSGCASDVSWDSFGDLQDFTGRIVLKLFDRIPSDMPQNIRSQVLAWLSCCPVNIESVMRPGCVILTLFLFMNKFAWEELLMDLHFSLTRLIQIGNCDFWSKGRIFVQIREANAYIVDGEVYVNTPFLSSTMPRLVSVHPLAVVVGEETKITLKGHNICLVEASITCSYEGKYEFQNVLHSEQLSKGSSTEPYQSSECQQELSFIFSGALGCNGRCFIEVEQYAIGDFMPLIVADKEICTEICTLEHEIGLSHTCPPSKPGAIQTRIEMEVRSFLNELGWIFHWNHMHKSCFLPEILSTNQISLVRFKYIMVYTVERGWCALSRKLLDIYFRTKIGSVDDVLEFELLHIAVWQKCRPMVNMLLAYEVSLHDQTFFEMLGDRDSSTCTSLNKFIFFPGMVGPSGLTPLHVAASIEDAEELIDTLTNDSAQAGLDAWDHSQDSNGQTPHAYAVKGGHQSYIHLVERKLARRNMLVSTCIGIPDNTDQIGIESYTEPREVSFSIPRIDRNNVTQFNLEGWRVDLQGLDSPLAMASFDIPKASPSAQPLQICQGPMVRRIKTKISGLRGPAFRIFILSMVAIALFCACVCLLLKGPPHILFVMGPFRWESVHCGYL